MKKVTVVIQELPVMKGIGFLAYSEQPENIAWANAKKWLNEHTEEVREASIRIFGFNNPNPSVGSSKYGYEFVVTGIDGLINRELADGLEWKELPGGLYAMSTIQIESVDDIPSYWAAMNAWCKESSYSMAQHQWLEEHSMEGLISSLWLPIK